MSDYERVELLGGLAALERHGSTLRWSAGPDAGQAMRAVLARRATEAEEAIGPLIDELRDLLAQYDPVDVIGQCAVVATTGYPERDDAATRFGLDARVEYLAGLALSLPEPATTPAEPGIPEQVWSLSRQIFELEHQTLMAPPPADLPHRVASARFLLRLEGLLDRMQGYVLHLERMLERVFAPIANDCRAELGFNPADLPALVRGCWRAAQEPFQEALDRVAHELDAGKGELATYSDEEFAAAASAYAIQEIARSTFIWTPAEVAEASGIAESEAAAALAALSCRWGCQPNYGRPTDMNRFRRFPLVDLGEDGYFFPLVWNPLHEAVPWFLTLVRERGFSKLEKRFLKTRDDAAEALTREALAGVFGPDRVLGPLFYDTDGEVDGVVDGTSFALVAETKAHHVTDPARRGAPERIRRLTADVLDKALEQSARTASFIDAGNSSFRDSRRNQVTLRGVPEKVLRVAVSFERADPITLLAAGLAAEGATRAWAVSLADLLMVTDILNDPAALYDYVHLRAELAADEFLVGFMESDFLGAYLENRLAPLRALGAEHADAQRQLGYHSVALNAYFTGLDVGHETERPTHGVPTLVTEALTRLYRHDHPHWSKLARMVMSQPREAWAPWALVLDKARATAAQGLARREFTLRSGLRLIVFTGPDRQPFGALESLDTSPPWLAVAVDVAADDFAVAAELNASAW